MKKDELIKELTSINLKISHIVLKRKNWNADRSKLKRKRLTRINNFLASDQTGFLPSNLGEDLMNAELGHLSAMSLLELKNLRKRKSEILKELKGL